MPPPTITTVGARAANENRGTTVAAAAAPAVVRNVRRDTPRAWPFGVDGPDLAECVDYTMCLRDLRIAKERTKSTEQRSPGWHTDLECRIVTELAACTWRISLRRDRHESTKTRKRPKGFMISCFRGRPPLEQSQVVVSSLLSAVIAGHGRARLPAAHRTIEPFCRQRDGMASALRSGTDKSSAACLQITSTHHGLAPPCESSAGSPNQSCIAFRHVPSFTLAFVAQALAQTDPLPSWNAGRARNAIVDFVQTSIDPANPMFVPQEERIATFDQDGTLWVEQPMYTQLVYALDRVPAVVAKQPALKDVEPFRKPYFQATTRRSLD